MQAEHEAMTENKKQKTGRTKELMAPEREICKSENYDIDILDFT